MRDLTPSKDILDPIEIASRDEIAALQLTRLQWTLSHAYELSLIHISEPTRLR